MDGVPAVTVSLWLFEQVDGQPETYVRFATDYDELEQPLDRTVVEHVYAHRPLTAHLARRLNPDVDWDGLREDLAEIGNPTASSSASRHWCHRRARTRHHLAGPRGHPARYPRRAYESGLDRGRLVPEDVEAPLPVRAACDLVDRLNPPPARTRPTRQRVAARWYCQVASGTKTARIRPAQMSV
jgi:hypothetical protein